MPFLALAAAVLFVIYSFDPLLAPLADSSLVFISGDFTITPGPATVKADQSLHILLEGKPSLERIRFFLLGSLGSMADAIELSDSQFHSILILLSMLIGSAGICWLVMQRVEDNRIAAALTAILVVFYFLNPWSVERIIHIWIWFTYAILPMQMALGLRYMETRGIRHLGAYSLLLSLFGPIPHSFMYMLGVHGALISYGAIRRARLLLFAMVPIALYCLINAPFLAIFLSGLGDGFTYPGATTGDMLRVLSRDGELVNLLAFSNNWFPLVEKPGITDMPVFTVSAFAIFIFAFSAFACARMRNYEKAASLVFFGAILLSMLIAQGMNNSILAQLTDAALDLGLQNIIGPFREWARMSIMIPVFMVALLSFSIPNIKRQEATVAALGAIVLINIATGPSLGYVKAAYSPLHIGDAFTELAELVPYNARIVQITGEIPAVTADGEARMVDWPKTAIGSPVDSEGFRKPFIDGELTLSQMEELHISYFAMDRETAVPYGWMSCSEVDYLKLCSTGVSSRRFSVDGEQARVTLYTRIDSTRWMAKADASGPFMLEFAEVYSPEWEARVYREGKLLSTVGAVPLKGSINGFWIGESGELEIRAVYRPQEDFEGLFPVSIAGILGCIIMIAAGRWNR